MRINRLSISIFLFLLSACASAINQIQTQTPMQTFTPTSTIALTPTPTSTPIPLANLEGVLFFDYNGSGLLDENEPAIANFEVCVKAKDICVSTNENGHFVFENLAIKGTEIVLNFIDPNVNNPALAFRYINNWKGTVKIPAYEMKGVQIPEQDLNDTEIIPLDDGIQVSVGDNINIGLMQGFLTLPFIQSQVPNLYIWGYFDDLNSSITCGSPVSADGVAMNYDGKYTKDGGGDPVTPHIGVGDAHEGLDYSIPLGSYIINAGPNAKVWLLPHEDNGELRVHTLFQLGDENYQNAYGHLEVQLVALDDIVYRGQIIGISGKTGASPYHQLHFDLSKSAPGQCNQYIDPFRTTFGGPYPKNFSGSNISYWTVDNNPQFAK